MLEALGGVGLVGWLVGRRAGEGRFQCGGVSSLWGGVALRGRGGRRGRRGRREGEEGRVRVILPNA